MKKLIIFVLTFSFCALLYGQWEDIYEIEYAKFGKIRIARYIGWGTEGMRGREKIREFESLKDGEIPENMYNMPVTVIDPWAFWSKSLTKIILPSTIRRIGNGAFSENLLVGITIPEGVRSIGDQAFKRNELTNVVLPPRLLSLGEGAFEGNKLTALSIPGGLRTIGDWAFHNNQINNMAFLEGLRSIGKGAFANNSISTVIFPNSVRDIKDYAFSNNPINRVSIGNNVRVTVNAIDHGAFYQCYHNKYGRRAGIYIKDEKTNEWSFAAHRTISNKTK